MKQLLKGIIEELRITAALDASDDKDARIEKFFNDIEYLKNPDISTERHEGSDILFREVFFSKHEDGIYVCVRVIQAYPTVMIIIDADFNDDKG